MTETIERTITHEEMVQAFKEAEEAAIAARPGDDGGTCNMDSPVMFPGKKAAAAKKAAEEAGIELDGPTRLWGGTAYFVRTSTDGQANMRARMSEAAYKSLSQAFEGTGIVVSHYQQMD